MINLILKWLGYKRRTPSLILKHMVALTHNSWLEDLRDSNRLKDYEVRLWAD
jgi:hypothetical protein